MDNGQEEITEQSNLQNEELVQESTALEEEIFGQSLVESFAMPLFSLKAVQPGNYSPDNWSSGYRIRTVDSADKRAELFNDFSYWMVRKFEIEIDTRHANDMNIIKLVNDATSSIANVSGRINTVKGTADYAKNLADHLGNTVIKNVEKVAINAQNKANAADGTAVYAKDLAVHLSTNVIKDVEKTALYAKDLADYLGGTVIKNVETTANSALSKANAADGTAVYAKNLADHLSGTVIKDVEATALNAKTTADTAKTTADTANGTAVYAKNLADHLGGTVIKNVEALANDAVNTNSTQQTQINMLMASEILSTSTLADFKQENSENLTFINATLKGLKNYDDTSLYNKIDTLFKFYFNGSSFESGYNVGDGVFTTLIKGQFTRLIAELNRQLTLSFTTTTNNIENFKTYLREEFALLNDWASLQVDWSTMINDNILVAIAALDKIVAKPNGDVNVNVPPSDITIPIFDYDRLKGMLDELSFGNLVNEAGTNLWDVLQQLIDSLGGVVESIVGIVPELIDKLIALIIPENPNFFSEDVEALTSAFDIKFEWAFNLTDSFKSIFSQPKSLKSLTIPIAGKEYKVVPNFVDLNLIRNILTGYFCFLTLFTSYKRIVGGGDVIQ